MIGDTKLHPQLEYIITGGQINEILNSLSGEEYREVHAVLRRLPLHSSATGSAEKVLKCPNCCQDVTSNMYYCDNCGYGWVEAELREQRGEREQG
jgi:hypothetical protein